MVTVIREETAPAMTMKAEIELALVLPAGPLPLGQHIVLTGVLRNVGREPVCLNMRASVPEDVALHVSWGGRALPYRQREHARRAQPTDLVPLPPASIASFNIVLSDFFDLTRPGRYTVSAHYRSADEVSRLRSVYPGMRLAHAQFCGRLASEEHLLEPIPEP